jgi:hypothetical protein
MGEYAGRNGGGISAQLGIVHALLSDWLVKKDSILSFLSLPLHGLRISYLIRLAFFSCCGLCSALCLAFMSRAAKE